MTDSEVLPDTQLMAASDDSIPCGQTRFHSTQDMESSSLEARHQGLPTLTPGPVCQAVHTKKHGPDDMDKDTGLKRKCVDKAKEMMDSQETDSELLLLSSLTTILAGDFNCVLNVNLDKRGGNAAWGKGGWTMQEQSAGVPTLWQSGPHARHVPQQTLLPQLQKPPLSSLPRLPTAMFAPYHRKQVFHPR